jgi:hypothetical protein
MLVFRQTDFCEARILEVMAVEGQGDKRERGLFTDLCFQADQAFFLTTGRIDVQHRSMRSIGV